MKLTDLDPHWIMLDGKRVGFVFRSPTRADEFWQTCFPEPVGSTRRDQWHLAQLAIGNNRATVQGCSHKARWQIEGGIEAASFETLSVTPSLDGSAGGGWHGHITKGRIVGGI